MYTLSDNYTLKETLLNNTKLLFNRAGWAGPLSLLFPFTRLAGLFASGEISEHSSMGFFGVKKDIHIPGTEVISELRQ